jgi:hypothetical protein
MTSALGLKPVILLSSNQILMQRPQKNIEKVNNSDIQKELTM